MERISSEIESKVKVSFENQTMMATMGAKLVSVEVGKVSISAPVLEGFRQQQDFAHGGLIFSIGDTAAGYAALSVMPVDVEVMTVELKINLMAPAPANGTLIAEGKVLKPGKRLVIVTSDVWSEDDDGNRKQVAALQGPMIPVTA